MALLTGPLDPVDAVTMALLLRRTWVMEPETRRGGPLARARLDIAWSWRSQGPTEMYLSKLVRGKRAQARITLRGLGLLTPEDMPVAHEMAALMTDAVLFRYGYRNRADAWRGLGINPETARGWVTKGRRAGIRAWADFTLMFRALTEDDHGYRTRFDPERAALGQGGVAGAPAPGPDGRA